MLSLFSWLQALKEDLANSWIYECSLLLWMSSEQTLYLRKLQMRGRRFVFAGMEGSLNVTYANLLFFSQALLFPLSTQSHTFKVGKFHTCTITHLSFRQISKLYVLLMYYALLVFKQRFSNVYERKLRKTNNLDCWKVFQQISVLSYHPKPQRIKLNTLWHQRFTLTNTRLIRSHISGISGIPVMETSKPSGWGKGVLSHVYIWRSTPTRFEILTLDRQNSLSPKKQ